MNSLSIKRIFGLLVGIGIMTTATLTWACNVSGYYPKHYYRNRVNTALERRYDYNHNGWLSRGEYVRLASAKVDSRREWRCDYNRNGFIDSYWEQRCK